MAQNYTVTEDGKLVEDDEAEPEFAEMNFGDAEAEE